MSGTHDCFRYRIDLFDKYFGEKMSTAIRNLITIHRCDPEMTEVGFVPDEELRGVEVAVVFVDGYKKI